MAIVGLGTDIVQIGRIAASYERSDALMRRILTPYEQALCLQSRFSARYLAKRFCAKEAAAKALGTGIAAGIGFQDMEIRNNQRGKPELIFMGAAKLLAEQLGVTAIHLSLSDEREYAVATVILEQ